MKNPDIFDPCRAARLLAEMLFSKNLLREAALVARQVDAALVARQVDAAQALAWEAGEDSSFVYKDALMK